MIPAAAAAPRLDISEGSAHEERQQEQRELEVEELEALAGLGRRQPRRHRHRAEHLALDQELVAAALERFDFHELAVVGRVERQHQRFPTFAKSSFKSSNARSAAARPAPNTPPPGCWNGPTR